ncbi:MAG: tRNA pseudouridine(55) synthase TruB [Anaerolineae bacterium]
MSAEDVFGFLNLNKPVGPTSHDVVARVRRLTHVRKVGHAGTLDPLASGVLVICLGPATRLSDYAMHTTKQYRATVRLGAVTDTYDAEGQVVAEYSVPALDRAAIEAALARFQGEIEQVPPMYSAIKQGGKKLYELARAGQEVARPPRKVTIEHIELVTLDLPELVLDVTCSSGTYIRSLAHDLGAALGTGAYLAGLVRTASGPFHIQDAVTLEDFEDAVQAGNWRQLVLPPDIALQALPAVHLTPEQAAGVLHGQGFPAPATASSEARAYDDRGQFVAILRAEKGAWRCVKVFPPA